MNQQRRILQQQPIEEVRTVVYVYHFFNILRVNVLHSRNLLTSQKLLFQKYKHEIKFKFVGLKKPKRWIEHYEKNQDFSFFLL